MRSGVSPVVVVCGGVARAGSVVVVVRALSYKIEAEENFEKQLADAHNWKGIHV
jgi:hypothetical protein